MQKYIPKNIEPKWQKKWAEENLYKVNLDNSKEKFYLLVELPYPSGDLHVGHWFAFGVTDALARFKRMQGKNVFFPIGFDAFGLPAENAAIKRGLHPRDWTLSNIDSMRKQFALMGSTLDWEHEVITCLPEYYKWNQWIFLKMLEKGIAYKGKTLSNWCPLDQTVLADEQVIAGKCDRCGSEVILKEIEQWFLKITAYADKLLWTDKTVLEWPKSVKEGQNAWIGKSEGMEIDFKLQNSDNKITVYTVYPETIFGVTYMVLAPEHKLVEKITISENKLKISNYIKESQKKSQQERISLDKKKTGEFTGAYCINPVNGKKVPIWIADYVLAGYGTGAVMGVPASDHRDFEFANKYGLEVVRVIGKDDDDLGEVKNEKEVLEEGVLVNSEQFNGLSTPNPARNKIKDWMEEQRFGQRKIQYHLHDWSISRQRYWGTPIPIINCKSCGIVPVSYEDLPVKLPEKVDHSPKGKAPLATAEDWLNVKCSKCGGEATRETETMDGFVDNSWYFYRYLDPKNDQEPFSQQIIDSWMPIDIYFGGSEHTLGHTMYSRFFTKFLHEIGLVKFDEYALKRYNHGVILGPDGARMSKSKGNVINPDEQVAEYGADAVRLYLGFIGPYDIVAAWNPGGLNGVYHFLQRVWGLQEKLSHDVILGNEVTPESDPGQARMTNQDLRIMHRTIKKVGEDINDIKFNTAISSLMEWLNFLSKKEKISSDEYETFLLLLSPFAPHITEELWNTLGLKFSVHNQQWPSFDEQFLAEAETKIIIQVNGKLRDVFTVSSDMVSNRNIVEKMALNREKIKKSIINSTPKKIIYVPGKILNIVI